MSFSVHAKRDELRQKTCLLGLTSRPEVRRNICTVGDWKQGKTARLFGAIVILTVFTSACFAVIMCGPAICGRGPDGQSGETIDLVKADDYQVFPTSTLQPQFLIPIETTTRTQDIEFYIDTSRDIVADPFMHDKVRTTTERGYATIHPQFSLFPGVHEIRTVVPANGSRETIAKRIVLAYTDDFSSTIGFERFWGTSDKWYVTEDGKLRTDIGKGKYISDISFRRGFPGDVVIEFDFVPFSQATNISVFLGEGFSFFIGDGDNSTIRLKKAVIMSSGQRKESTLARKRTPFKLEESKTYRARIRRTGNDYAIWISKTPGLPMEERHLVFATTDKEPETRIVEKFHTVGFAVWRGRPPATTTGAAFGNVLVYEPAGTFAE